MTARLISAFAAMLIAVPALAQPDFSDRDPEDIDRDRPMHPGEDHPPRLVLGPPDGFEPPEEMPVMPEDPDEARRMGVKMFFRFMDRSGDGVLDWDEFSHWVLEVVDPEMHDRRDDRRDRRGDARDRMGDARDRIEEEGREHMEDMMAFDKQAHPKLASLPNAPRCSDRLRERELRPREEGAACHDHEGNLIFRTVCNVPDFGATAISLPADRAASCFGLEALTGRIGFEIVSEGGEMIWDLSMGPESYEHLKLDEGIYHIRATGGGPRGAVTISFVDVGVE